MTEIITIGGLTLRFLQTKQGTASSLDLFEMVVQPNARMPVPHHHESWDETVYGLSGVTTWRIGGEDIEIAPGQSAFIRRGTVHGFSNRTDAASTCLCVLTPGTLDPAYFREMASLAAAEPSDPAALKSTMLRHGLVPAPPA